MTEKCTACRIEFEPKTKYIDGKDGNYHYGCWAKINKAILPEKKGCFHVTSAEDTSHYAFMHRKYGCPTEGAEWPQSIGVPKESYE